MSTSVYGLKEETVEGGVVLQAWQLVASSTEQAVLEDENDSGNAETSCMDCWKRRSWWEPPFSSSPISRTSKEHSLLQKSRRYGSYKFTVCPEKLKGLSVSWDSYPSRFCRHSTSWAIWQSVSNIIDKLPDMLLQNGKTTITLLYTNWTALLPAEEADIARAKHCLW